MQKGDHPSDFYFLGFLPQHFSEDESSTPSSSTANDIVQRSRPRILPSHKDLKDPFLTDSSSFWFCTSENTVKNPYRLHRQSVWRFSMLTGKTHLVFTREHDADFSVILSQGPVGHYLCSVKQTMVHFGDEEDAIFLRFIHTKTKAERSVRLHPTPPEQNPDPDPQTVTIPRWYWHMEVLENSVVLFANQGTRGRHKAYTYAPSEDPAVWNLTKESAIQRQDTGAIAFSGVFYSNVSKQHVGIQEIRGEGTEDESSLFYVYDLISQEWEAMTEEECRLRYFHRQDFVPSSLKEFYKELSDKSEYWCLGDLGCGPRDQDPQGVVIALPRRFAPTGVSSTNDDGREEKSRALFLVPLRPPTMMTLAYHKLLKTHPRLLEENEETLRAMGIPPLIYKAIGEHRAWDNEKVLDLTIIPPILEQYF